MRGLMERLGLGRRDLRAWAMYDWANSAFQTTIVAAIFPIFFQKVAAAGMPARVAPSRFAWATTIAILIVAVIAPLLGAVADYAAIKKRLLAVFLAIGACATAAMYCITRGDWMLALVLFVTSFTNRSCRTWPRRTSSIASPPPATRWVISAGACCSRSTS